MASRDEIMKNLLRQNEIVISLMNNVDQANLSYDMLKKSMANYRAKQSRLNDILLRIINHYQELDDLHESFPDSPERNAELDRIRKRIEKLNEQLEADTQDSEDTLF